MTYAEPPKSAFMNTASSSSRVLGAGLPVAALAGGLGALERLHRSRQVMCTM